MTGARDRTHAPRERDAYMTIDPRPIPALLKHITLRGQVWEPACGTGEMVKRLSAARYAVFPTDIDLTKDGGGYGPLNFLEATELPDRKLQSIVTNPPNTLNFEFAMKALALTEPVQGIVALYQRHEWNATKGTAAIFDHPAYAMRITCRFRPKWFERKPGEKAKSPFHRFSWFVWDWTTVGRDPIERFA